MQTVVELPLYRKRAESLLSDQEQRDIISHLAENSKAGVLIRETGGVRKLRWRREGTGKSGGVRVIYFHRDLNIPLFLLTVYGKGEQDNLTKAQCNQMKKLTNVLVSEWEKII
ncbi:MAG: type II toxin-antitoxin system RelE/ParE family toxin [Endozoicomonas sp.]|uniref:type II toxin-antitoxin system RelE/ParE family toxin n=1 Tax=Endozoicomonas sp. TaxID=1892382 RepID=UPI003D9AC6C1